MLHCPVVKDLAPLYVEGELSREVHQLVEDHVASCPRCRDYLDGCRPELWETDPLDRAEARARGIAARVRRRVWSITATALVIALVMALGSAVYSMRQVGQVIGRANARLAGLAGTTVYNAGTSFEHEYHLTEAGVAQNLRSLWAAGVVLEAASGLTKNPAEAEAWQLAQEALFQAQLAGGKVTRLAREFYHGELPAQERALLQKTGQALRVLSQYVYATKDPDRPANLGRLAQELVEELEFYNANGVLPSELPSLLDQASAAARARAQLPELTPARFYRADQVLFWERGVHYWEFSTEGPWQQVKVDMVTGAVVGLAASPLSPERWLKEPLKAGEAEALAREWAAGWPGDKSMATVADPELTRHPTRVDPQVDAGGNQRYFYFRFHRVVDGVLFETDFIEVIVHPWTMRVEAYYAPRWGTELALVPALTPEQAVTVAKKHVYAQSWLGEEPDAELVVAWSEREFRPFLAYQVGGRIYVNALTGEVEALCRRPPG